MNLLKRSTQLLLRHHWIHNFLVVAKGFYNRKVPIQERDKKFAVLMNGPSLNGLDIADLGKKYDNVVVGNHFAETDLYDQLRPSIYVIQDSYFWKRDVLDHYVEKRERLYNSLNKKTSWPLLLYFPHFADFNLITNIIDNTNISVNSYYAGYIKSKNTSFKSHINPHRCLFYLWKHNYCAPPPENLLVGATYLSYLKGANVIDIYGADMSFFRCLEVNQKTNRVGIHQDHFYGSEFHEHHKDKKGLEPTSMAHELKKWSKVFETFETLNLFYEQLGTKVYNCGPNSFIDAFERKPVN